jgi:large subunit ribosomal protein L9
MARHIQVVLTEDLPSLGKSGDLVRVRPGFARNFLVPRGLAAVASKENVHRIEHEKRVAQVRAVKMRGEAEKLAASLKDLRLTIGAQVGEEQKLYGSVTSRDIEEALAEKGFEIDRRKIVTEPLRALGVHKVPVKIAAGIDAEIEVELVARN